MVFYFSGTGNSQFVAFQLRELLAEQEAVSINTYCKAGRQAAFYSKRPLVCVVQT